MLHGCQATLTALLLATLLAALQFAHANPADQSAGAGAASDPLSALLRHLEPNHHKKSSTGTDMRQALSGWVHTLDGLRQQRPAGAAAGIAVPQRALSQDVAEGEPGEGVEQAPHHPLELADPEDLPEQAAALTVEPSQPVSDAVSSSTGGSNDAWPRRHAVGPAFPRSGVHHSHERTREVVLTLDMEWQQESTCSRAAKGGMNLDARAARLQQLEAQNCLALQLIERLAAALTTLQAQGHSHDGRSRQADLTITVEVQREVGGSARSNPRSADGVASHAQSVSAWTVAALPPQPLAGGWQMLLARPDLLAFGSLVAICLSACLAVMACLVRSA